MWVVVFFLVGFLGLGLLSGYLFGGLLRILLIYAAVMVPAIGGLLNALPEPRLYRPLLREGRLESDNALHAMSEGGTLTVSTRMFSWSGDLASREPMFRQFKAGDALATVEVQDTGTGIPENLLPQVFDPFFTTKPAGHGTGLGLAVVKKIVELHGGAIAIQNITPRGARVTLILKLE